MSSQREYHIISGHAFRVFARCQAATGANLPVASLSGGLILEEAICLLCPDIPSANNTEKAFTIWVGGGRYVMAFDTQCSARTGSPVCFYFKPALNINLLVNLPWRQCTQGKNPNAMKGGRSALHTVYRRSHVKTTHCQNLVLMNF